KIFIGIARMTRLRFHLEVEANDVGVGPERDGHLRAGLAVLRRRLGRGIAAAEYAGATTGEQKGNKGFHNHGLVTPGPELGGYRHTNAQLRCPWGRGPRRWFAGSKRYKGGGIRTRSGEVSL